MTAEARPSIAKTSASARSPGVASLRAYVETAGFAALLTLCLVFGLADVNELGEAGAAIMPLLRLLLRAVIGLAALSVLLGTRSTKLWTPLLLPLGVWLASLTASAVRAPTHQSLALESLLWPVQGALMCLAAYYLTHSRPRWRLVGTALGVGGGAIALIGLAQAADVSPVIAWLRGLQDGTVPLGDVARVTSTLSHPNVAAMVFELTLPLLVAVALIDRRPWQFVFAGLAAAVLVALVLTFSRTGLLASLAGLAVMAGVIVVRGARRTAVAIALAGGVVMLATLAVALFTHFGLGYRLLAELDQSGYRASYAPTAVVHAEPGQVVYVPVRLTNTDTAALSASGRGRIALGYHLLEPDGRSIVFDSPTTLLPNDLPPGAGVEVQARVHAPLEPGAYVIQWDAVRDGAAWFSWRGADTATTRLVVEPGPPHEQSTETGSMVLPKPVRVQLWAAAWAMFNDYRLFGVGADNFHVRFGDYSGVPESKLGTHAHSMYLESLADTGVVGFLALVWLLLTVLRLACQGLLSETDRDVWILRAALLASLVAWLVHGVLDDLQRFWPAGLAFWIIVGLIARGKTFTAARER